MNKKPTKDELIRLISSAYDYDYIADKILELWPEEPKAAWKPKEGDYIWCLYTDSMKYSIEFSGNYCEMMAAVENFDEEKSWSIDQFRQRGRFWEAK